MNKKYNIEFTFEELHHIAYSLHNNIKQFERYKKSLQTIVITDYEEGDIEDIPRFINYANQRISQYKDLIEKINNIRLEKKI